MYSMLLFMVCQRRVGDGLERFRTACAQVKDAGLAAFQEPQVNGGHIAHVNEVALEVFAAFKQFRAFAVV